MCTITRNEFIEAWSKIKDIEKALNLIEYGFEDSEITMFYHEKDVYIILHRSYFIYVNWYKLTHVGMLLNFYSSLRSEDALRILVDKINNLIDNYDEII
jgi:hypothetical protein